jgi:DNA-binding response OmpR family regulator
MNSVPTILICEDDEIVIAIIEVRLRHSGYNVLIASDGKKGLDILSKNADIDLIITDLIMPEFGGLELIRAVRTELLLEIPILVISALEGINVVDEAIGYGANDFITKPFRPDEIVSRVKHLLKRHYPQRFSNL